MSQTTRNYGVTAAETQKVCEECGSAFFSPTGRARFCAAICRMRKWTRDNPHQARATKKAIYERKRADGFQPYDPLYYAANKSSHIARYRKWKYGIAADQMDVLLRGQEFCCGSCKRPFSDALPFSIDHDHTTGKVRGLLCKSCNNRLGKCGDGMVGLIARKERLEAFLESVEQAIAYLDDLPADRFLS